MNRSFLALALALSVFPVAAIADDTNAPAPPTAAQRQAMFQTFQRFGQQEEQLRQQLRWQVLSSLTPVHRRAVGALIGELAIEPSPDPNATAKRIDAMLLGGEQSRILAAHQSFAAQSKTLRDQLRAAIQSQLPAGAQQRFGQHWQGKGGPQQSGNRPVDAGTLVLAILSPNSHGMMMGFHGGPGFMHAEGPPPAP
jgi:hypothetical protein